MAARLTYPHAKILRPQCFIRQALAVEPGDTVFIRVTGKNTFEAKVIPGFRDNHLDYYSVDGEAPSIDDVRKQIEEDVAKDNLPKGSKRDSKRLVAATREC